MTILIMNPMDDVHGDFMISKLDQKGIEYVALGSTRDNDYAIWNHNLLYNGEPVQQYGIRSVFFRSVLQDPNQFQDDDASVQYTGNIQFSAQVEAIRTWLLIMHHQGVRVINPPRNFSKYYQLHTLHQAGLPLPKTCVTSSPELARSFISEVKNAICKPLPGGSYCRKVTPELIEQLDLIRNEPVIFQEEIPGQDIRVNMLNGKVLSAHVIKTSVDGVLDYRTDPNYHTGTAQYEEVKLPDKVTSACDRAMKQLGLRFSGIDLRRTPEHEYVLIECNSMPAYLDIELKTGAPITEALIEDMLDHPPPHCISAETPLPKSNIPKKTQVKRGTSIFDYFSVFQDWKKQELEKKERLVVDLNPQQQAQLLQETGKWHTKMEIGKKDGQMHVLRVW